MDREEVSSSVLSSVGYDPANQLLEVELQDGKIYQYTDIPAATYGFGKNVGSTPDRVVLYGNFRSKSDFFRLMTADFLGRC